MWRIYRLGVALILSLILVLFVVVPVLAIANPDAIAFGTGTIPMYKVFENVNETGDMLFIAEGYVHYIVEPTDYTANEAFLFEIIDAAGTTTLLSRPLNEYEDRPISIYQTAAQVTALGLVSGSAYGFRITPNPLLLATEFGGGGVIEGTNQITAYLAPSDYIDQSVATDEDNPMRDYLIMMAENIEANDSPPVGSEYITTVQGIRYLTITGGDIFLAGIPGLATFCPILFQAALEAVSGDTPTSTGAYTSRLNPTTQWGATIGSGFTMLGSYLGVNQELAGSMLLFIVVLVFAVYVYRKTESGVAVLLLVAATPFMGAWLGLMPLALAFVFVIIIVVLMGYFFFSRGAL